MNVMYRIFVVVVADEELKQKGKSSKQVGTKQAKSIICERDILLAYIQYIIQAIQAIA